MTLTFLSDRFVYDIQTRTVRFMALEGLAETIICAVGEDTLADLEDVKARGKAVVPIFVRHRREIETAAQRKFARGQIGTDRVVFVERHDLVC